ncbi:hypothetical protein ACFE04_007484 [Oxalis oulophora]
MGVYVFECEILSVIPPARLFKAFVTDGDNLIRKIAPQVIKSIDIVEGDGGPGSIKQVTFHKGHKSNYLKQRIDSIDSENFTYCYSIVGGDAIVNKVQKISFETKILPSPDGGGSILKNKSTHYAVGEINLSDIEEQLKAGEKKRIGMLKAIEAYLLENPQAYI